MPNYRRAIVPGGAYFFTIATYNRTKLFSDPTAASILGDVIRAAKQRFLSATAVIAKSNSSCEPFRQVLNMLEQGLHARRIHQDLLGAT